MRHLVYQDCSIDLPYSKDSVTYSVFKTHNGYQYTVGNKSTGIFNEEKLFEVTLVGRFNFSCDVEGVSVADMPYAEALDVAREPKIKEIALAFEAYVATRTPVSLGFDMQFNQRDISMVDGAIRFMEMTNQTEGYLTDADNVNHFGLSIAQMKQALMEMTGAYLQAHLRKQELRQQVIDATTQEELDAIEWGFE